MRVLGGDAELVDVAGDDAVLGVVACGEPRDTHPVEPTGADAVRRCLPWWLWKPDPTRCDVCSTSRPGGPPAPPTRRGSTPGCSRTSSAAPSRGRAPGRGLPVHLLLPAPGGAAALAPGVRRGARDAASYAGLKGYDVRGGVATVTAEHVASPAGAADHPAPAARARPRPGPRSSAASGCTSGRWSTGSRPGPGAARAPGRCGSAARAPTRWSSRTGSAARTSTRSGSSPTTARPLQHPAAGAATTGPTFEQPGCLHAGMDLYKHAYRLTPLVASELVADCFELARDIRVLDMRAVAVRPRRPRLRPGARWRRRPASRSTSRPSAASPSAARRCGSGWSSECDRLLVAAG